MLNRHMDEIIREQQFSGRVLGVKASYTPRFNPETGERLESFWQNGNIDERADTIYIRASKAVIVGTGGMHGQSAAPHHDRSADVRATSIQYGPSALVGPLNKDGSGIIAGMKIGANLAGMMQNYQHSAGSPTASQHARRPGISLGASSPAIPRSCSRGPRESPSAMPDGNM